MPIEQTAKDEAASKTRIVLNEIADHLRDGKGLAATPETLRVWRSYLLADLTEIETICTESAGDCRKRMGTRVGNILTLVRSALGVKV